MWIDHADMIKMILDDLDLPDDEDGEGEQAAERDSRGS